jgi:hypothetical protein
MSDDEIKAKLAGLGWSLHRQSGGHFAATPALQMRHELPSMSNTLPELLERALGFASPDVRLRQRRWDVTRHAGGFRQ